MLHVRFVHDGGVLAFGIPEGCSGQMINHARQAARLRGQHGEGGGREEGPVYPRLAALMGHIGRRVRFRQAGEMKPQTDAFDGSPRKS